MQSVRQHSLECIDCHKSSVSKHFLRDIHFATSLTSERKKPFRGHLKTQTHSSVAMTFPYHRYPPFIVKRRRRRDQPHVHVLFGKCDCEDELWVNDSEKVQKYEVVMTAWNDKQCVYKMWTVINEASSLARQAIYHIIYGAIKKR